MKSRVIARPPIVEHAHKLTLEIYRLTARFLEDDPDSLAVGLRRAALTVTGKLAAHHSGLPPDITQFCDAAMDAAFEMDTLLAGAMDNGQISKEDAERLRREYQEIVRSLMPKPTCRRRRPPGQASWRGQS